ncbi:MAG: hypothetical protein Q9227_006042 [Pyrenula ochraceoflavens]
MAPYGEAGKAAKFKTLNNHGATVRPPTYGTRKILAGRVPRREAELHNQTIDDGFLQTNGHLQPAALYVCKQTRLESRNGKKEKSIGKWKKEKTGYNNPNNGTDTMEDFEIANGPGQLWSLEESRQQRYEYIERYHAKNEN